SDVCSSDLNRITFIGAELLADEFHQWTHCRGLFVAPIKFAQQMHYLPMRRAEFDALTVRDGERHGFVPGGKVFQISVAIGSDITAIHEHGSIPALRWILAAAEFDKACEDDTSKEIFNTLDDSARCDLGRQDKHGGARKP